MIAEATIEKVIEQFESQAVDYEKTMREFASRQPAILTFLLTDTEGVLSADEQDYLLYLATVIWKSVEISSSEEDDDDELSDVSPEDLAEAEEANWQKMETASARRFRERLDPFFENYPQEDLLAFVEDMLTSEEEQETDSFRLTDEGREPMFIALKTVIDVLCAA